MQIRAVLILLLVLTAALLPTRAEALYPIHDGFGGYSSAISGAGIRAVAVQPWDGKVLIGGDFTISAGDPATSRQHLARLNADGTVDLSFRPTLDRPVNSIAIQANGSDPEQSLILVGGSFTSIGPVGFEQPRKGLARFRSSDGSLDDFKPVTTAEAVTVNVILLQPDGVSILAGGSFAEIEAGLSSHNLARLSVAGPDPGASSWSYAGGLNGEVNAILLQDGLILVGGDFAAPRSKLARFKSDGSFDASFSASSSGGGAIRALALQADGKIIVGGDFAGGDLARNYLARLDSTPSGVWVPDELDANPDGPVASIGVQPDGKILVAGSFTHIGTPQATRNRLARLNIDGTLDDPIEDGLDNVVKVLSRQPDGKILVGGDFALAGTKSRTRLARFYPEAALDDDIPDSTFNGRVNVVAQQPGGINTILGNFTAAYGQVRNRIARLQPNWKLADPATFNSKLKIASEVWVATPMPDKTVFVGGDFSFVNYSTSNDLKQKLMVRLDAQGNGVPTFNTGIKTVLTFSGSVSSMLNTVSSVAVLPAVRMPDGSYQDPMMYLGGYISRAPQPYQFMGKFNSATGLLDETFTPPDPALTGRVRTIAVLRDDVSDTYDKLLIGTITGKTLRLKSSGEIDLDLTPLLPPLARVNSLTVQSDGQIILTGEPVNSFDGSWQRTIFRFRVDQNDQVTVDESFRIETAFSQINATWHNAVNGIALQADGSMLIYGVFDKMRVVKAGIETIHPLRSGTSVVRIKADGTFDDKVDISIPFIDLNPRSVSLQPDGKMIITGEFASINNQTSKAKLGRLSNGLATEDLSVAPDTSGHKITWLRGGTSPELWRVYFEHSADGTEWTTLGNGHRIAGGWEINNQNLAQYGVSANRYVRARGYVAGSNANSLLESVRVYYLKPAASSTVLTVTAVDQEKFYGQEDPELTYSVSGFVNGDTDAIISGSLHRAPGSGAGNYAIDQGDLSAGSNYTIAFTGANFKIKPVSLAVTAAAQSKPYGTFVDPELTYSASGFVNGDTEAIFTGTLHRAPGPNVGSYAIDQGDLSAGSNYGIAFTGASLTITPVTLTVAAAAQSKPYGTLVDPELTYSASGFVNGETEAIFTGTLHRAPGPNVGSYAIDQGDLSAGSNYGIAFTGSSLTITPVTLTVAAAAQSKPYGTLVDPELTYSASGFVNGDTEAVFTGTLHRAPGPNVGSYAIDQGDLSAGSNYGIDFTGSSLTITPVTLTVAAATQSKPYGTLVDPELTYSASGFVNGDTEAVFTGTLHRAPGPNVGSYAIDQGDLSAGSNYGIAFTGSSLTITPVTLTVAAAAQSKPYGTLVDPELTYSASGFVNGDTEAVFTGTLHRAPGPNVGSYAIDQGDLSAGSNYGIAFTGSSLTITPVTLTVAAAASEKSYGAADPIPLGYSASGYVNGDTEAVFTGTLHRAPGPNVGSYAIDQGSLSAGSNYGIAFTGADLTITPAPLTITAEHKSKQRGTSNPGLTVTYSGLASFDTVASLGGIPLVTTTADETSPTGSYPITASLGSITSTNYSYFFVQGILAVTGGATQAITFDPMRPKTFGDADFDPGATASSHLDVEYASSATGIATVVGRKLRVLAPGTSEITASQAGNQQYEAAADVTRTLIVNPPPWNGLGFDGSDDLMQVADAPQLNFGNLTDFTIETWLQLDGSQPDGTGLLSKGEGGVAWSGYQLILHQNRIAAEIGAGTASFGVTDGLVGISNLNDGQWHHVALSVERATATASLYLDGRLEAQLSDPDLAVNLDNADLLRLGVDRSGSRLFKGRIDEMRLWNSARSKDEIRAAVSQIIDPLDESHLAAYYHFDEGDVGLNNAAFATAPERTANGANGSLQGFALSGTASNWIRSGAFLPLLETAPITQITSNGATSGGEVYPNYYPATEVGLCWGTTANPGLADSCSHSGGVATPEIAWLPQVLNGGGAFVGAISGLLPGSTYHVRAFATNQMGTAYGNDITFQVARLDQTISFGPIAHRTYGDAGFNAGGSATSGLPVTYTSSNTAVADLVNGQIRIIGAGSTVITASQAGNDRYNPAPDVSQLFTVNKKALSVTADNKSRAYLAANPVLTVNCQGFVAGEGLDVVSGTPNLWTAATPASPVGSYDIVVGLGTLEAPNYSFTLTNGLLTVGRAAQSISFDPVADSIYGDAGFALAGSATSGLPVTYISSNPAVATVVNGAVLIIGAGSTVITASQGGNEFYQPAIDVSHPFTVNRKVLTITADNQSRAYHTANPALTAAWQGYIQGEDITFISGALELSTTATISSTVGAYEIVVGLGTLTAANYSFVLRNGILTVRAASQTIAFDPMRAKTFGDGDFDPGATASSLLEVEYTSSAPGIATVVGRKIRVLAPGTTEITASQAGNEQYEPAADVMRTLTVNPPPWHGLGFDGSDDVMQVADAPQLNFGDENGFSIETWLQLDGSQPNGTGLLSKGEGDGAWSGYQLILYQDRIAAEIGGGTGSFGVADGLIGTSSLNDGQWHHVALTVDRASATASLYLDGRLEARLSNSALGVNPDNADDLKLAVDRSGSRFFKGRIDEVRLWNSVRSREEIRAVVSQIIDPLDEPHLAAYYHFDEGDVGLDNAAFATAPERTANGANGSLQGFALNGTDSNWIRSGAFLPLLETAPITLITTNAAAGGGTVYPNYYPPSDLGLCWGTTVNPGLADTCSHLGRSLSAGAAPTSQASNGLSAEVAWVPQASNEGGFLGAMTGLAPGVTYHVRAFATNLMGTAYGNNVTFQVGRLNQTISFGPIADRTYGDAGFNLSGSATSGLPISYTSSNPAVAILINGQIRIVGAGSTVITASQAGNQTYNPAADVSQPFTVNKKALTVRADNKSRAYQTLNPWLTASYQGFIPGEDISVITGAPDLSTVASPASPVGSYDIAVGPGTLGAQNYRFVLTKGTLTVFQSCQEIVFPPISDRTYGDAPFEITGSSCSGLPVSFTSSNPQVARISGNSVIIIGTGSVIITASQGGNGDLEIPPDVSRTLIVHKSGQALSFPPLTRKVLGDAPFSLAATASSALPVSYLSSDPSVAEISGSVATIVGAGTAVITAIQEGDSNYNAALPASQPLTVSLEGTSPLVVLSTLATGAVTADPVLNVMGTASDASGIASLTVNGIDLTGKADLFSSAVPLAIGDNSVTVSAKDGAGNVTTHTLGIVLDATAPALELLEPADNSVTNLPFFTASGTVAPGSAVTFKVNGGSTQSLPVVDGGFTGSGYLESGVNTIEFSTVLTGRSSRIKRSVILAPDKPFVAITGPGEDIRTEKATMTIRGIAGAVGSAVSMKLDVDGSVFTPLITDGAFQQQIALDHAGQISIRASVTDSGGKVSVAQRNVIRIEKILGDLNVDGLVDIQDAAALLRISLGMDPATPQAFAHGDVAPLVNGVSQPDGKIDVGDVLVLLRKIVGLVDY